MVRVFCLGSGSAELEWERMGFIHLKNGIPRSPTLSLKDDDGWMDIAVTDNSWSAVHIVLGVLGI